MSDVKCVICGEPWNFYGLHHGDMLKWEAKLFKKGAGCPCCEGQVPETGLFEPMSMEDIEYGDLDPQERLEASIRASQGRVPKWERPEPEHLWQCQSCFSEVVKNPDDDQLEWSFSAKDTIRQFLGRPRAEPQVEPKAEPAHKFGEDYPVCEDCLEHCNECATEICSGLTFEDVYDPGWCGHADDGNLYCVDCLPDEEGE